jgi:hypothetical protein
LNAFRFPGLGFTAGFVALAGEAHLAGFVLFIALSRTMSHSPDPSATEAPRYVEHRIMGDPAVTRSKVAAQCARGEKKAMARLAVKTQEW